MIKICKFCGCGFSVPACRFRDGTDKSCCSMDCKKQLTSAKNSEKITQEFLWKILDYNKITGEFFWKIRIPGRVEIGDRAGYPHHKGYWEIEIRGHSYRLHRIAWLYVYGEPIPPIIDHRDRKKSNNAIDNLRKSTRGQNRANSKTTSSTGFKGVTFNSKWGKRNPYRAGISSGGVRRLLGYFPTAQEAHAAYCEAAREAFGEFFNVS